MTAIVEQQEILKEVAIDKIFVNPDQPRHVFDTADLEELAQSIRQVGLIQPPIVSALEDNEGYQLIAGERRLRACKLVGLATIPVLVRPSARQRSAEAALVENLQRIDLNPMEVASAMRSLMNQFGLNQEALAQRVGKKRSTVANYLRLLTLPATIRDSVSGGQLTMGHAKVVLSLDKPEMQLLLHQKIIEGQLTVRDTEKLAEQLSQKKATASKPAPARTSDVHIRHLERELERTLGTRVAIREGSAGTGCVEIDYYSLDDLDRVLECLGVRV
jgi:ParB family chromosome partitioning protein